MALTATQQEWLENDNIRVILVEAAFNDGIELLYCNNHNTNPVFDTIPDIFCNITWINCNDTAIVTAVDAVYFSNTPYITDFGAVFTDVAGNDVQDIAYDDILQTIPNITSKIDSSSTVGTLTFLNPTGEYDTAIITNSWEGQPISIFIGDPTWARADFIQVLVGLIDKVIAPSSTTISISVRDKNDILTKSNESRTIDDNFVDNLINSATQFSLPVERVPIVGNPLASIAYAPDLYIVPDSVINTNTPICLGKCYNVEPVLIDAYNHVYMIHDGTITGILEVGGVPQIKSNGLVLNGVAPVDPDLDPPLQYEIDTAIGCIRLLDHPRSSKITVDVEGAADRPSGADLGFSLVKNSAAWLMEWLALEKSPLEYTDLDYDTFTDLDIANSSALGVYYKGEEQVSDLMTNVINSIGAFYRFNRLSKLQLVLLDDPNVLPDSGIDIEQDYVVHNGISLIDVEVPRSRITMSYHKNWTVMSKEEQAGILSEEDYYDTVEEAVGGLSIQQTLASEYQTITVDISGVKREFPLAESYDTVETLIYDKSAAETEIERRKVIRGTKRYIYKLQSIIPPLEVEVGDTVDIIYDRFGFDGPVGKRAVVISLSERLTNNRVDIEAWL